MSEDRYRSDEQYRRRVDRLVSEIEQDAANIRKERERTERTERTVNSIMADATAAAAQARSSLRIIVSDPQTARLISRALQIFAARLQART
jgi:hypothetical protein